MVTCDFDGMNGCDLVDIDLLVAEIVAGTDGGAFDGAGDGLVDLADRDQWLIEAGALNLMSGNAYLLGDANLDAVVDGQDFIVWNSHKFTTTGLWSQADWNADGITDGQDFIIWNTHEFQASDAAVIRPLVSEPQSWSLSHTDALFASLAGDEGDHRRERLGSRLLTPERALYRERGGGGPA